MITIKKSEYDYLTRAARKFELLGDWGVDNWSGYYQAMEEFRQEMEEE